MMVTVRVPATTANIGPGFDCLGLALDIYNHIEMRLSDKPGLAITISGEGATELPLTQDNLVYQAAQALFDRVKENYGLVICQRNSIPLARGLGSSAAAIVGGIVGANHLLGSPLSTSQVIELASQLEGHPDNVAPAVLGGAVVSVADNSEVVCEQIKQCCGMQVVAVVPAFQLSTKQSRAVLPDKVSHSDAIFNVGRVALLISALQNGSYDKLALACQDKLHQTYRASLIPGFSAVQQAGMAAGAHAVVLSGAGPTVLALASKGGERIGKAMQQAFKTHGVNSCLFVTKLNQTGVQVQSKDPVSG